MVPLQPSLSASPSVSLVWPDVSSQPREVCEWSLRAVSVTWSRKIGAGVSVFGGVDRGGPTLSSLA